jgi:Mg2+/Co2+ transporter CorB
VNEIPISLLFALLFLLLVMSAFFSGAETGLMSINRYRLLHLASQGNRGARLAQKLLEQPDRLIGIILLGNNFVNISASAITTIAFAHILGDAGVLVGTVFLTVVVLVFAEVAPKTFAAFRPEQVALPAAYILYPLLRVFYPLVRIINASAGSVLRIAGHHSGTQQKQGQLSQEELRIVLEQGASLIPEQHRKMLLNVLSLEQVRVEDIMVPRSEILGINLNDDLETILNQLEKYPYSRAVVYRGDLDQIAGILNLREIRHVRASEPPSLAWIESHIRKPYFIPEGTPLPRQLVEFQRQQRRLGLVVNEYGDLLGLVTLADILEEIVGEFTTDPAENVRRIEVQKDGTILVDARISVRTLNRRQGWDLPSDEANTLSGLITSCLESFPQPGAEVEIANRRMRVEAVRDNVIRQVRIWPATPPPNPDEAD